MSSRNCLLSGFTCKRLFLTRFQLGGVILQILFVMKLTQSPLDIIASFWQPTPKKKRSIFYELLGGVLQENHFIFSAHIFFYLSEVTAIAAGDSALEHQGKSVLTASSV